MKRLSITLTLLLGATALGCSDDGAADAPLDTDAGNVADDDADDDLGTTDDDGDDDLGTDDDGDDDLVADDDGDDDLVADDDGDDDGGDDVDAGADDDLDDVDAGADDDVIDAGPTGSDAGDASSSSFVISSPNFDDGAALPEAHTCEGKAFGDGVSPELNWSGAPEGTVVYALVFKDTTLEDAGQAQYAFHWAAWNIPVEVTGIPEEMSDGDFPEELGGGEQFRAGPPHDNEFFGPCPSWQALCLGADRVTDSYSFTLYAFDAELSPPDALPREDEPNHVATLAAYFEANAIAWTEVTATSDAAPTSAPMCPADAGAGSGDAGADVGSPDAG